MPYGIKNIDVAEVERICVPAFGMKETG